MRAVRGSSFILEFVSFLHYKSYNLKRGGSNIDSPDCIKNKKNNNKYYQ